jgi:hypothetical protein
VLLLLLLLLMLLLLLLLLLLLMLLQLLLINVEQQRCVDQIVLSMRISMNDGSSIKNINNWNRDIIANKKPQTSCSGNDGASSASSSRRSSSATLRSSAMPRRVHSASTLGVNYSERTTRSIFIVTPTR